MSQKLRSKRGTFTAKVKDAIFCHFGESTIPRINTTATPSEILKWKKNPAVNRCYNCLFENNHKDFVDIVDKSIGGRKYTDLQMAYVIAICTTFLNPKNTRVKCEGAFMKKKIHYYLVSFF